MELEHLLPVSIVPLFWKFRQQGLNEWKGLSNDTQQSLPSPSLSSREHQRLWKKELEQEFRMKREEKWKQLAKHGSPMSPPNSKGL
jgi:hypothetical protein